MEQIVGFRSNCCYYVDGNNYLYKKNREKRGRKYYLCRVFSCKARVVVVGDDAAVTLLIPHNYQSEQLELQ